MLDSELLAALGRLDTPTLCNALERVAPERRGTGFTRHPLLCARPERGPIVGYARTARVRAADPPERDPAEQRAFELAYYRHVGEPPHPTITVIEDVDDPPGVGAWWGEVHTHVHRGLGSLGVVTNGSVRDWDQLAEGFQVLAGSVGPSHAHVHVVEFGGSVEVGGMTVSPGDLVHADRHGALVIPRGVAPALPDAAAQVMREERVLIEASRVPGFGIDTLARLLRGDDH